MTRIARSIFVLGLCAFLASIACTPSAGVNQVAGTGKSKIPAGKNTAVVFLTGNTLSTLQPCGCSVNQLGGFDRRPAIIATVPEERRALVDTGNLLKGDTEQDMIKLGIIMQALSILEYDLVALDDAEYTLADTQGLTQGMPFALISNSADTGAKSFWSKTLQVDGGSLTLNVASIRKDSEDLDSLEQVFTGQLTANLLIVDDCSADFLDSIEAMDIVDVVICPTHSDEPRIVDKDRERPLVISVGRLGKYFGKLTIELTPDGERRFYLSEAAVEEKLPQDDDLVMLYKDYQAIVKEEGLLEKVPKAPLPDGLKYLGSENCHTCHGYEYDAWAKKKHAHAYQSLVDVGSQYDPECIGCHVVGFGYESGFINEKSAKDLRNVGCEVCHGPGSDHMKAVTTGRTDKGISDVQTTCVQCHTTERSPGYGGHEKEYLEKIVHWREPKQRNSVKK